MCTFIYIKIHIHKHIHKYFSVVFGYVVTIRKRINYYTQTVLVNCESSSLWTHVSAIIILLLHVQGTHGNQSSNFILGTLYVYIHTL